MLTNLISKERGVGNTKAKNRVITPKGQLQPLKRNNIFTRYAHQTNHQVHNMRSPCFEQTPPFDLSTHTA